MSIIADLKAERAKIDAQIAQIQEECSHPAPARESKNFSTQGDYDFAAPAYWVEHCCRLCEKRWSEDL